MESTNLKILTLNCWGIPVISKDRKPRMEAIGEELSQGDYDVVCLQEVWTDSDYNLITEKAKGKLPYSHYFYSGVIGSGICILSKYPFQEVFFHQWPVNGYVHKLQHGDWFGGKGVGLCRLRINNFNVNVYSAHLHAEYDRSCDEYLAHRVLQAFDTAQFIRLTAGNADLIILAGDLNTEPGDLAYKYNIDIFQGFKPQEIPVQFRIIMSATSLIDSYIEAGENVRKLFSTNESYTNSYTDKNLISTEFEGKRIDYIMFHHSPAIKIKLSSYDHPLPNRVPDRHYSYSDHEAVTATLEIFRMKTKENVVNAIYKEVLIDSMTVCDSAMQRLNYHRHLYWFLTAFLLIMLFVTIGVDAPFNYTKMYHLIRVLITGILCFTIVMATLWNNIEYNAVLAGKRNMEISLKQALESEKDKTV